MLLNGRQLIAKKTSQKFLSASPDRTDKNFVLKLYKNSNAIVFKTQVYFSLYNATCFKYRFAMIRKYQFDFFCFFIEKTKVTGLDSIDISWNNLSINPWNPALILLIRFNHDLNFILSNIKALALVYYIRNYITQINCSQYQLVMGTTFV